MDIHCHVFCNRRDLVIIDSEKGHTAARELPGVSYPHESRNLFPAVGAPGSHHHLYDKAVLTDIQQLVDRIGIILIIIVLFEIK